MSNCAIPDFEEHFNSWKFSDVEIEILEEASDLGVKRKPGQLVPGHSVILMGLSSYCKAKLTNWSTETDLSSAATVCSTRRTRAGSSKHRIELSVPAGQADIALRLIQSIYQSNPDLADVKDEQLMQLLLLADRFGVPKVQAAVTNTFKSASAENLQWSTVLALLDLPDSCAAQDGCKDVVELAMQALLQKLGDLDLVWADQQLQELLLALPHAALLRLVQHKDTKAAAEATVVYTIEQWYRKQTGSEAVRQQQLQQLMQQVRMQHLSLLYINTVMMRSKKVLLCYTPAELGIAAVCTTADGRVLLQGAHVPELDKYPAWTAAKRPVSSHRQVVEWNLPLAELQPSVEELLKNAKRQTILSGTRVVQGRTVQLRLDLEKLCVTSGRNTVNAPVTLSLYLTMAGLLEGSVCQILGSCRLKTAACLRSHIYSEQQPAWGERKLVDLGAVDGWAAAEAALRQQGLVDDDGTLHFSFVVQKVV